jgi:hypothetical protein
MAKYVVAKNVISVCINGKVYHKKDKQVFDDDKGFDPAVLQASYKAGFLAKKEGQKEVLYVDDKKVNTKKAEVKETEAELKKTEK